MPKLFIPKPFVKKNILVVYEYLLALYTLLGSCWRVLVIKLGQSYYFTQKVTYDLASAHILSIYISLLQSPYSTEILRDLCSPMQSSLFD